MELGRPETYYASPLTKTPSQEKLQQENMIVALKPASPEKRPEIQSSGQQLVPMSKKPNDENNQQLVPVAAVITEKAGKVKVNLDEMIEKDSINAKF